MYVTFLRCLERFDDANISYGTLRIYKFALDSFHFIIITSTTIIMIIIIIIVVVIV